MRNISAENLAALEARQLVARDFLWIVARDRVTNAPVTDGMWSGVGNISASVIHPDTGAMVTRDWFGSGTLVQIDDIPLVSNLSVQNVTIRMSQVSEHVAILVRQYECKQARVEIYRGLFNPDTRQMVAPAECRFVGFVDQIEITTPSENEEGSVTLTCASHTQEMTRANTSTRSHATQILRDPNDTFYQDAATVQEWEVFWGSEKGKVQTQKKRKKFLGIF
ncbi:hypothetical protein M0654_03740 [Rhizobium sp. NTR19]|uniref:Uncharacterized protein n=1 Tax=Neorhizobium turbinariae TaxID=2937795 RepID=A0ABT0IMK1_9HYPH|nr:hypothetical protein [Neorhizobium turbinariae]MCK8779092.1 hypothetical protein [Neorhizobium turbinariae]